MASDVKYLVGQVLHSLPIFKVGLALYGFLLFSIYFRARVSKNNTTRILIEDALNIWIYLGEN